MTQRERDRLVALRKADKRLITQKQAAQQTGLSERHLRRLLAKLRREGDQAVVHAARGRASNRKLSAKAEKQAVAILSQPVYAGFGPTLAAEYLEQAESPGGTRFGSGREGWRQSCRQAKQRLDEGLRSERQPARVASGAGIRRRPNDTQD